ncbi:MAG: hypothetical protein GY830_01085 [Bacteroidetes bacterium]|nr:hypothetical protein [Bacteroidota bacterium]
MKKYLIVSKVILLCLIFDVSFAKNFKNFRYVYSKAEDENDENEKKEGDKDIIALRDKYRLGLRFNIGPSLASIISKYKIRTYKDQINFKREDTKLVLFIEAKPKIKSIIPYNFEFFAGYKFLKWLGVDIGVTYNFFGNSFILKVPGEAKKISVDGRPINNLNIKIPIKLNFKNKQIEFYLKLIFFQKYFYEGIGFKVMKLFKCEIIKKVNYNGIKNKAFVKLLKEPFEENHIYKITNPKFPRFYPSILFYLGYEFDFGLNLETSLEFPLKLINIIQNISNVKSKEQFKRLFSPQSTTFIMTSTLFSRPILYFSLGYNFMKLF